MIVTGPHPDPCDCHVRVVAPGGLVFLATPEDIEEGRAMRQWLDDALRASHAWLFPPDPADHPALFRAPITEGNDTP